MVCLSIGESNSGNPSATGWRKCQEALLDFYGEPTRGLLQSGVGVHRVVLNLSDEIDQRNGRRTLTEAHTDRECSLWIQRKRYRRRAYPPSLGLALRDETFLLEGTYNDGNCLCREARSLTNFKSRDAHILQQQRQHKPLIVASYRRRIQAARPICNPQRIWGRKSHVRKEIAPHVGRTVERGRVHALRSRTGQPIASISCANAMPSAR
jgi:hypothetical protein